VAIKSRSDQQERVMDIDTVGFNRGHDEMKGYEKEALKVVKAANGEYYSESDYKKLKVSSQWLKFNASHEEKNLDVIFKITSTEFGASWYEVAIRQPNGGFEYGFYLPVTSTLLIVRDSVSEGYHDLGVVMPDEMGGHDLLSFAYSQAEDGTYGYFPRTVEGRRIVRTLRRRRVATLGGSSKQAA
jgi:hypothetical protein